MPFNWSRIRVSGLYAGIQPALDRPVPSVFGVIDALYYVGPARVSQSITALPCPAAEARAMGLPAEVPVIGIAARLFDADGGVIEVSHALYDPARFRVKTDVSIN